MSEPQGQIAAAYFDGLTARKHDVLIGPTADRLGLAILFRDGQTPPVVWSFDRIRALADHADRTSLTLTVHAETHDEAPRDPARLVVSDPDAVDWFRRTRPSLFNRDVRPGTYRKVALWLGGAAAAVLLMLFVILPGLADFLARHIPVEQEVAFGHAVMKQVEFLLGEDGADLTCNGAEGQAALDSLTARLTEGQDLPYDLQVRVFDHDMPNAFAAPGGQIVLFRGLLDDAANAEEVAGVLGHEIGHVAARDPTRLSLRAAGSAGIVALVLGDVTGGSVVALAGEYLMQASYTRDAEAAADDFALMLLAEQGVSSAPLADFFDRITSLTDDVPEYLSSHPLSAGRAERIRAGASYGAGRRILDEGEWQALRAICG